MVVQIIQFRNGDYEFRVSNPRMGDAARCETIDASPIINVVVGRIIPPTELKFYEGSGSMRGFGVDHASRAKKMGSFTTQVDLFGEVA